MAPGTYQPYNLYSFLYGIYQQPVRSDMTLSCTFETTLQRMITMLGRQRDTTTEQSHNLAEKSKIEPLLLCKFSDPT